MAAMTRISVIIPVKPGGMVKALEGLKRSEFPLDLFEVIVAEGRRPSRQRNQAAACAAGEILYFLDDDSLVPPDAFQRVLSQFQDPEVAAVGGPSLTPTTDTPLQRAIGAALASPFGGGWVRNRYRKTGHVRSTSDRELILCNLSFRRETFLGFGGLDERLYPNEENELLERISRAGLKLVHDPELAVLRSQRPTFRAFLRQLFGYGRGRAEQTLVSLAVPVMGLMPALFIVYLVSLPLVGSLAYAIPFALFLLAVITGAVVEGGRAGSLPMVFRLLAILPALHLAYGVGLLAGFARPRLHQRPPGGESVELRTVKPMGEPW
jgi:cellulose synthase/poly-beta-1,6-N-acetylglucosamine synthase-like glycosyltransferase